MKLRSLILATCCMQPVLAENSAPHTIKPLEIKKKDPFPSLELVKYFGLTVVSSYGFLYLINKNAQEPVTQQRLMGYALGIPAVIGLGMYIGIVAGFKPCTSLIT